MFFEELFSVLQSGLKTKVYCHVSTPCTTGCRLRHRGWRKYSQKKWLEKVSLHRTAWELLRGFVENQLLQVNGCCSRKSGQS